MIRVIRRDRSQLDCLSVSSWYTTDQFVLGKGKGRGKLASDREGSVTCHMGTQFCFHVYLVLERQLLGSVDMIQVIRQDCSQPDCLSVSSGYTTDQFVLGVLLGSSKTSYVPPRSHVARVWDVPAKVKVEKSLRATEKDP
ncbi:uncharacterized protein E5676_scaffold14G00160 [Cucumis melo var. makuwa]|uniref:Uncharacterized protein n=1 Tax=Cucumis melo var. makuwa TaxID=1194695 RepID=A0A5D3DRI3_CUCMM|nr:uncharacterized protein E6C27_scaffold38G00510 [Cucumis melo var. makuwa]TYK26253.1 uncharacterized protein E5676_scaffold14G00160 [Cucumis melo var. makuwa]